MNPPTWISSPLLASASSHQEQIAFAIASPHPICNSFLSVMDLFEVGGEILAIRRRESQKLKAKDKDDVKKSKEVFLRIETVAENVWKKRLLQILQLLYDD